MNCKQKTTVIRTLIHSYLFIRRCRVTSPTHHSYTHQHTGSEGWVLPYTKNRVSFLLHLPTYLCEAETRPATYNPHLHLGLSLQQSLIFGPTQEEVANISVYRWIGINCEEAIMELGGLLDGLGCTRGETKRMKNQLWRATGYQEFSGYLRNLGIESKIKPDIVICYSNKTHIFGNRCSDDINWQQL